MDISLKRGTPQSQKTACMIVGIHAGKRLSRSAETLDRASKGMISRILKRGDLGGGQGETLMLPEINGAEAERVLLVGCGKQEGLAANEYLQLLQKVARAVADSGVKHAISTLTEITVKGRDLAWQLRQEVLAFSATAYRFDRLKSKPKSHKGVLSRLGLLIGNEEFAAATAALRTAKAIAAGISLAKDLGNLPGNHCTPTHLAQTARDLAKQHKSLKVEVLERAAMEKLGMGSLLSVARGSRQPPVLITLEYHGAGDGKKPLVLVGKGVTFDSGGISIKPAAAMDEMKYDMSGAGSVLAVLSVVAELDLPLNVVGVVPATENLPDGDATKPGDVVTSMSGQTIEILNTDAEGRLILCDALTYSAKYDPETVIDLATLTGACVVALGKAASGLFSNDDALADEILAAGEMTGDRAWRLPLWDDYQKQLDSPFADMANVGGREGGAITAACFLSRFTKDYRWAHLDIAGTAWHSGKAKGSTGRPVPLLMELILKRCAPTA